MGWKRRVVYGERGPSVSQRRFHQLDSRVKGFSGPVGSGKSKALCYEAIRLAYDNPGCTGLLAAPTYVLLRDATQLALLQMLDESGVPYEHHKAESWLYLSEPDSRILLRTMDNPERLMAMNLAWFGVDELTYTKEDSWKRLEARLRDPKAKRLGAFAVWTPKGFDWVWNRFIGPEPTKGYSLIYASRDNPAITDEYYETLKASYDERFYQQEVLGKYLSIFAGQTYYAFERAANVQPVAFDPRLPLIWSLDFNVNPMASVLIQYAAPYIHVLGEIVLPNSNTPAACDAFFERVKPYMDAVRGKQIGHVPLRVQVYGDPAGSQRSRAGADKSDWAIVKDAFSQWRDLPMEFMMAPSAPLIKARVNAVNAALCNANGQRNLIVDPSCRELIADLEQVAWKTDAAGNSIGDLDKANPKRTHACVTEDTKVFTTHGLVPIVDLVGTTGYVYGWSAEKGCIAVAEYSVAAMTSAAEPVYRVVLDDGSTLRATGNHRFLMRDGSYRWLERLVEGDSLMPFYWREMGNGYLKVRRMETNQWADWEWAHRLVGMDALGVESDYRNHIHHIDGNKLNNDPSNLELRSVSDHAREHMKNPARYAQAVEVMNRIRPRGDTHHARNPEYWTPERRAATAGTWDAARRARAAEQNRITFAAHGNPNDRPGVKQKQSSAMSSRWANPAERERLIAGMRAKRMANNHKVVSIEPGGVAPVYCLKTSLGNFATDSLVIGNSDALGYYIEKEHGLKVVGGPRSTHIA